MPVSRPKSSKPWPADKVERWELRLLIPYVRNARMHSAAQVSQIAASIRQFGFTIPILVDEDGSIIAGHARTLAAQELHLNQVPVMVAHGWTDAQKRAYRLADNQLTLNAGWDDRMLVREMQELHGLNFDLTLTGFSQSDIDHYLNGGIWTSNLGADHNPPDEDGSGGARIIVTCAIADRDDLAGVLREALADAGIEAKVA